jgi:hypothetical protein
VLFLRIAARDGSVLKQYLSPRAEFKAKDAIYLESGTPSHGTDTRVPTHWHALARTGTHIRASACSALPRTGRAFAPSWFFRTFVCLFVRLSARFVCLFVCLFFACLFVCSLLVCLLICARDQRKRCA